MCIRDSVQNENPHQGRGVFYLCRWIVSRHSLEVQIFYGAFSLKKTWNALLCVKPVSYTHLGEFSVLLLIVILSALLVNSYCKKASIVWYIGGIGVGGTLLALLFSYYVIPFDITWFQYGLCVVLLFYLIFLSDRKSTRLNSSHITRSRMPSSA